MFVHYNLKVCFKIKRKIKESFKKTDADSSGGTIGIFAIAFKGVKAL